MHNRQGIQVQGTKERFGQAEILKVPAHTLHGDAKPSLPSVILSVGIKSNSVWLHSKPHGWILSCLKVQT